MMSWQSELTGDPLPWLLEPDSPGARYLALRDLLDLPQYDHELVAARQAAHTDGPIAAVLAQMDATGYWAAMGPGYNPKYRSTVWSVILLAQLGASINEDERIRRACLYLIDHALASGGQFSTTGAPSGTIDCLQGNLCWALLELGFEDLEHLAPAFEWMSRSLTGEGMAPQGDKKAPVRYYAAKCGPTFACGANNQQSCAWGAIKVMLAFTRWPLERRTPLIERAITQGVDFLFSTNPAKADYPSGWSEKPSQNWWKFGFPVFYVTDLLQNVDVLARLGYGDDLRLADALQIIRQKQDSRGRWTLEYDYTGKTWVDFGAKKQPNKWVTLRALQALKDASHSV
jgi:hypothetical protein